MRAEQRALVIRPEGQAAPLIAGLAARGIQSLHLPMLRLVPVSPLPPRERQRILDLDRYQHLIFISSNAARFGLAAIDDYWPQYPAGQRCWAVGGSTAAVLEQAGLEVSVPEEDLSSEGLLALPGLQAVAGERVLIVKGEGGRDVLQRRLRERGAEVDTVSCYRREAPELSARDCQARLAKSPVQLILISSGEGLAQLSRLLQPRENTNLAGITVIAPSPRVAEQARALGWSAVSTARSASDDAMLEAAEAWQHAQGPSFRGEQVH
jgi:uroporphyrinogen-III synthase